MTRSAHTAPPVHCACGDELANLFVLIAGTRRDRMLVCERCARGISIAVPGSAYELRRTGEGPGGWAVVSPAPAS
ncbi:MAG: hypothetical protein IT196_09270 [Acidimicrobiales bacterium]|nr:hypothetical protein [Acidimicrobiales bacterium]